MHDTVDDMMLRRDHRNATRTTAVRIWRVTARSSSIVEPDNTPDGVSQLKDSAGKPQTVQTMNYLLIAP